MQHEHKNTWSFTEHSTKRRALPLVIDKQYTVYWANKRGPQGVYTFKLVTEKGYNFVAEDGTLLLKRHLYPYEKEPKLFFVNSLLTVKY